MIDDMQTITEQAAKNARDVFESYGSKAREAIDYMEQLIYAALRNTERAIPAADARAEALAVPEVAELIEAYSDIIDYGPVVLARKDQWARLKAAQEKIAALITETKPQAADQREGGAE